MSNRIISPSEAMTEVNNWLTVRTNLSLVKQLLDNGYYFHIGSDFDHTVFENQQAHAYFAITSTPAEGGTLSLQLSLLFISESHDKLRTGDFESEVYIYRAPYINDGFTFKMDPETADVLQERWADEHEPWLRYMIHESAEGMTLVSDVPTQDITHHFEQKDELFVFLGLGTDMNPAKQLHLLFYDGDSGNFLNLSVDDFTTPKPPFGTKQEDSYHLLQHYFNR